VRRSHQRSQLSENKKKMLKQEENAKPPPAREEGKSAPGSP